MLLIIAIVVAVLVGLKYGALAGWGTLLGIWLLFSLLRTSK